MARTNQPDYTVTPKQLLFCGSLSGMMSVDALAYFLHDFWPTIQPFAQVTIAGSNPSRQIQLLCQHAWRLEANFDAQRKAELYDESHFAILPFKHGSGSKLKLIEAVAMGYRYLQPPPVTLVACGYHRLLPYLIMQPTGTMPCGLRRHVPSGQLRPRHSARSTHQYAQLISY